MSRWAGRILLVMGLVGSSLLASGTAGATLAGENGLIAFDRYAHGLSDIFVINPDGTYATNLTSTPDRAEFGPSFSPDGTTIAFEAFGGEELSDIYTIPATGGPITRLTTTATVTEVSPEYSPDGRRIAYITFDQQGMSDLWAMDADGSDQVRLTQVGDIGFGGLTWHPDGMQLAYTRYRPIPGTPGAFDLDVYVLDLDSGFETRLTNERGDQTNPDYSPDGSRMLFVHFPATASPFEARILELSSGTIRSVGQGLADDHFHAVWTPDGTGILTTGDGRSGPIVELFDATSFAGRLLFKEQVYSPSWGPCGESCTLTQRAETELSIFASQGRRSTRVYAEVIPMHVGGTVSIKLTRRVDGRTRTVASDIKTIGKRGAATLRAPRFDSGRCKAVATFAGDADHGPSREVFRFRCRDTYYE